MGNMRLYNPTYKLVGAHPVRGNLTKNGGDSHNEAGRRFRTFYIMIH